MPDLSVEETAATQSTNDSEVGPGEEATVVEGASVDAEGISVFEGISVVAEETSLVAATSVRVAVVLSSIVVECGPGGRIVVVGCIDIIPYFDPAAAA